MRQWNNNPSLQIVAIGRHGCALKQRVTAGTLIVAKIVRGTGADRAILAAELDFRCGRVMKATASVTITVVVTGLTQHLLAGSSAGTGPDATCFGGASLYRLRRVVAVRVPASAIAVAAVVGVVVGRGTGPAVAGLGHARATDTFGIGRTTAAASPAAVIAALLPRTVGLANATT